MGDDNLCLICGGEIPANEDRYGFGQDGPFAVAHRGCYQNPNVPFGEAFGRGWLAATKPLEAENVRLREALALIARGVWTAPNSVESIVWTAREALKKD